MAPSSTTAGCRRRARQGDALAMRATLLHGHRKCCVALPFPSFIDVLIDLHHCRSHHSVFRHQARRLFRPLSLRFRPWTAQSSQVYPILSLFQRTGRNAEWTINARAAPRYIVSLNISTRTDRHRFTVIRLASLSTAGSIPHTGASRPSMFSASTNRFNCSR